MNRILTRGLNRQNPSGKHLLYANLQQTWHSKFPSQHLDSIALCECLKDKHNGDGILCGLGAMTHHLSFEFLDQHLILDWFVLDVASRAQTRQWCVELVNFRYYWLILWWMMLKWLECSDDLARLSRKIWRGSQDTHPHREPKHGRKNRACEHSGALELQPGASTYISQWGGQSCQTSLCWLSYSDTAKFSYWCVIHEKEIVVILAVLLQPIGV